jgi:hypothetical protein
MYDLALRTIAITINQINPAANSNPIKGIIAVTNVHRVSAAAFVAQTAILASEPVPLASILFHKSPPAIV